MLFYHDHAVVLFWLADRSLPVVRPRFGSRRDRRSARRSRAHVHRVAFSALLNAVFKHLQREPSKPGGPYSLRTENRPDALSTSLVKTADYRYPRPKVEEVIFYDHPRWSRGSARRWNGRPRIRSRQPRR